MNTYGTHIPVIPPFRYQKAYGPKIPVIPPFRLQKAGGVFLRDTNTNPPDVRNLLKKIGNERINSLTLVRTPLSSTTKSLLNVVSFGQLDKGLKDTNIDKLYHLFLLINNRYSLEKNEVIRLKKVSPIQPDKN